MDQETFYSLAEQLRSDLHEIVDAQIDELIQRVENPGRMSEKEKLCTLAMPSSYFKGKKPCLVVFPDGERIPVHTWRETAEVILMDCNADSETHQKLLDFSGKVMGRNRMILGTTDTGMRSPVKVDNGIFFESYFDTESLLKVLRERVLDAVGYDYSSVRLGVYDPRLRSDALCDPAFDDDGGDENEDETESDGFIPAM